jgi:sensor domain CHASE-containing protein
METLWRAGMTLLRKSLVLAVVALVGVPLLFLVFSRPVLLDGFTRIEERHVRSDVETVVNAISGQLADLSRTGSSLAAAARVDAFTCGSGPAPAELSAANLSRLGVDLACVVDQQGQAVWSEVRTPRVESGPARGSADSAIHHLLLCLGARERGGSDQEIQGLIRCGEGTLLLSSQPIVPSLGSGSGRGSLILGRYLDPSSIETLDGQADLSSSIFLAGDAHAPIDVRSAAASLSGLCQILVRPSGAREVAGYALMPTLDSDCALVLRVVGPRDIYAQGQRTVRLFILSVLMAGLLLGLAAHLLLEKPIHACLLSFGSRVRDIGRSNDPAARLPVEGRDELSFLAVSINSMLAELQQSEDHLRREQAGQETLLRLNQISHGSLRRMVDFAIEQGILLTGSAVGYIAFIDEDERVLSLHLGSRDAFQQCGRAERRIASPVERSGFWNEAVRRRQAVQQNQRDILDAQASGYLKKYQPIYRHLDVPILDDRGMVLVLGVANKGSDYDAADIHQLKLLGVGFWEIIRRRQAEVDAWAEEEELVAEATSASSESAVDAQTEATADVAADAPAEAANASRSEGPREGVARVTRMVRFLRDSVPVDEVRAVDLNKVIEHSVAATRSEWRAVAEVSTELDPFLPPVPCRSEDVESALCNSIVLTARALAAVESARGPDDRSRTGRITISSRRKERWVEIRISESDAGVSEILRVPLRVPNAALVAERERTARKLVA